MKGGRLIQVFQDVDMRMHHDGLQQLASKHKIDIRKLGIGDYVAFFNSKRTYLKLAAANGVIASRRMDGGRFYDLTCILGVVRAFHNTGEIQYERELKANLLKVLAKKVHARPVDEE